MFSPLMVLSGILQFYSLLVFVWVLGSWFPQWQQTDWFRVVTGVVEPYVNLFRGLGLRFGNLDLTAMAAMLVLSLVQQLLYAASRGGN